MASNATRSDQSGKSEQGEYATFENALKKVVSVPRSEIAAKLDAEKRARKRHKKHASDRASRDLVKYIIAKTAGLSPFPGNAVAGRQSVKISCSHTMTIRVPSYSISSELT